MEAAKKIFTRAHIIWFLLLNFGLVLLAAGIHFFKSPNNFAMGGTSGISIIAATLLLHMDVGTFMFIINGVLIVLGLVFLGRAVIGATLYSSVALSFYVWVLERAVPMARPFTDDTFLELCYAVILPAAGSAIIFNIGASSGGTDIIAMILKKYSSMNIGTVLMLVDIASVVASYFIFGVETGLFSTIGLAAKSLVIDDVIENINLCKCFNIICDDPKPICDFIINGLNRSATVYHAEGAFTHHDKTVIMTTMKRSQALKLRNYIKRVEPTAFMLISNSSEIIGKGFLAN